MIYKDFSLFTIVTEQANNCLLGVLSAFSQKSDVQLVWEDFPSSPRYLSLTEFFWLYTAFDFDSKLTLYNQVLFNN